MLSLSDTSSLIWIFFYHQKLRQKLTSKRCFKKSLLLLYLIWGNLVIALPWKICSLLLALTFVHMFTLLYQSCYCWEPHWIFKKINKWADVNCHVFLFPIKSNILRNFCFIFSLNCLYFLQVYPVIPSYTLSHILLQTF